MTGNVVPRVIVGGVSSGAGKTVLSIGLMGALKKQSHIVAPFKVGPDFIDPMFHKAACERASRNLDSYMIDKSGLLESFNRGCKGADIAIIEGVMGLFDSSEGTSEKGSTAEVAKMLGAPVILSVNVSKTARSAAAVVQGFKNFDPDLNLAGVILNMVGSNRHKTKVTEAVEKHAGVEVLGALPRNNTLHLPERHLGLVPIHEIENDVAAISSFVEEHVDIGHIVEIAGSANELENVQPHSTSAEKTGAKVGVMYDSAFRFYYAETLGQLETRAELVYIDALKDKKLPTLDTLYIGGGFPEVYASELESNKSLRNSVYDFCAAGGRVYGECGGLMYLGEKIVSDECEFEMTGFLPINTVMQQRYVGMGYVLNRAAVDNLLGKKGDVIVGHEFHHSQAQVTGRAKFAFKTERGNGIADGCDGMIRENVLAGYMHVHPLGCRRFIEGVVQPRDSKKIR